MGVGVRREELKKDMGKLLGIIEVHYVDFGGFMGIHLCQNSYCTFLISAIYCISYILRKFFFFFKKR